MFKNYFYSYYIYFFTQFAFLTLADIHSIKSSCSIFPSIIFLSFFLASKYCRDMFATPISFFRLMFYWFCPRRLYEIHNLLFLLFTSNYGKTSIFLFNPLICDFILHLKHSWHAVFHTFPSSILIVLPFKFIRVAFFLFTIFFFVIQPFKIIKFALIAQPLIIQLIAPLF